MSLWWEFKFWQNLVGKLGKFASSAWISEKLKWFLLSTESSLCGPAHKTRAFALVVPKIILILGGSTLAIPWIPNFWTDKFTWLFQYLSSNEMNLTTTKIYFTNTLQSKNQRKDKNKSCLKFPHFSNILGKIPWFFQSAQNSLTFPWPFSQVFQAMWESWMCTHPLPEKLLHDLQWSEP